MTDGSGRPDSTLCAHCGTQIDTTEWYVIATDFEGETVVFNAFCDESCKRAWQAESRWGPLRQPSPSVESGSSLFETL